MSRTQRIVLFVVALAGMALLLFTLQQQRSPGGRSAFLGTWTDEKGPPGNLLRLQLVSRPAPGAPGVTALDGKGSVRGLFGEGNVTFIWNHESFNPLRLNVVIGNRTMVAPIRMKDPDHLLIRLVPMANVNEWSGERVLEGPQAVILTRTKEDAE